MQLGHDEAKFLAGYLAGELEREAATTRAVIGAIPTGQEGYSPDGKSMNALKLAWHIASAEWWFLGCILKGEFRSGGDGGIPETVKSATDVLNWYDANVPPLWQSLRAMSAESLTAELDFFGIWKMPRSTTFRSRSSTEFTTAASCRHTCVRWAARCRAFTDQAATASRWIRREQQ